MSALWDHACALARAEAAAIAREKARREARPFLCSRVGCELTTRHKHDGQICERAEPFTGMESEGCLDGDSRHESDESYYGVSGLFGRD